MWERTRTSAVVGAFIVGAAIVAVETLAVDAGAVVAVVVGVILFLLVSFGGVVALHLYLHVQRSPSVT